MMDEEEIPKKVRKVLPAVPSKSRHIDCLSSGRPDFTSRGVSAPFCLYRNQSRYEHLVLKAVEGYLDKDGNVISTALNDTLRELAPYRQATAFTQGSSAEEFPIPVRLLNDALRDENYYRAPDILRQKVHDTIISCHHYDKSLVVHCGGKHMDTLIVRETRLCRPGLQSGVPGFTLPLGKGENLVQVVCASTSRWNACSHVLARTRNQLFHVRTVSLSDEMPKTAKKYDVLGRATVVLEPLQQWQFPHNIIDLSVSPLSGACLAFITCKGGNVYSWSATEGVRHVLGGGNPTVLSGSGESHGDNNESSTDTDVDQAVKKSEETEWLNVCASMHPMMCYVTKRANLHGVDVRCTPLSMHQLFSDTSVLSSMCHHTSSPHYLFTCNSESRMSLLDVRYPKRYVFQKFIGETASSIKFQSTMEMEVQDNQLHNTFKDPLNGVALTRRANARELLLHNVQVGVTNGGDIATRKGASCLFSLTQPFEMSSSMINCDSSSFPIVDKNHEHVQSCGAVIVPLSNATCVESTYVDKPRRDLSFNAILLQQSSLGDVHAQRILFGAPREKFWATCDITDRQHPLQKAQEAPTSNPSDLKNEHDVPFKYRKRNRKENSHLHNLYQGLTLRNNIFDSDMNGSYPLSCSDIDPSPSMNDEIVHDIVDDPKDTDNDVRDVKLLSHEETEDLLDSDLDSILGVVEMSYTLLEIQHIISEKYNAIPDWNHLRNYLSDSPRLREILLPPMRDDLPMDTSELDADKPKLVVKGEGQWTKITHVRQSQSVPRQAAKRCNCEEGVAGICDLGNDCSRLHRYVYENLDANPKFYGIIESPTSSARAASSSSSSSSSSSAAVAEPSSRIVKVGDEEINVDDLLSRLKKRWIENQERLS